jgi:hypothetical protein
LLVVGFPEPADPRVADGAQSRADDHHCKPRRRLVERAKRPRAQGQRQEDEPGQREHGTRVDLHLEPFGLDLVEHLQVFGRYDDEVIEDLLDDLPATLVREHEDLEHAVARGVGELLLDDFQRARGSQHPREVREARERDLERRGSGARQAPQTLGERTAGRDRCHEIAQPVGPCFLHRLQTSDATPAVERARQQSDDHCRRARDERGQRHEPQRHEGADSEQDRYAPELRG